MHQSFVMLCVLRRKQPRQVSNHPHTGPMQHPFLTAMPRSCTECQRPSVQKNYGFIASIEYSQRRHDARAF